MNVLHRLRAFREGTKGLFRRFRKKINWRHFRHIFQASEKNELTEPQKYNWYLIQNVPLSDLNPGTRSQWSYDTNLTATEVQENEARYDKIKERFERGEKPWPIVLSVDGFVLDGDHRLAVLNDFGASTVDILFPISKKRT